MYGPLRRLVAITAARPVVAAWWRLGYAADTDTTMYGEIR